MTSQRLQNFAWQLACLSKNLGALGGLGTALVLGCGLVYLSVLMPMGQSIKDIKQSLENSPITQKTHLNTAQSAEQNMADNISAFKKTLPQAESLHEWLAIIDQTASKQKLQLNRGDYKYSKAKQSQISEDFYLSKYEITLPVTGQYAQIRQFLAQVLHLQPALGLSDIKITRDNSLSPNVEAKLVFVLYLQSQLNSESELK